ncbi:MAG: ATP-binding protein [Chloroflexota bacterium]
MQTIRSRLGLKLFFSYLIVILVGMAVVGITTNLTTPRAYARHLSFMEQQIGMGMGPMMGQGFGQGQGQGQGGGMMADFYQNFQASFNESLIIAVAVATVLAVVVSFIFSRSIVSPVRAMMGASERIARGHYDERVQSDAPDELGQLASSFNQMAEQLEQVEAMRRRLIGDVTHELRTPLTAIKGSAEGLMDGILPANDETYQQIHAEAERLSRLVDDLQELSRVESRAFQLELRDLDAAALIRTVAKRLQHQFDEKRVTLDLSLSPRPITLHADEDRIVQVLTNLAGNALQYTPAGGQVTISVEPTGDAARFSVKDTGIGIPPGHLPHIFDRFYRVDKSRSRARGGSGIGLTIARHLVEAHGGRIWAESEGEGRGSTFVFIVPTK